MKQYRSVQEMVDELGPPEFAEEFRKHEAKWIVRLKRWLCVRWIVFKSRWF
jgi:hypothetical protein